jgi:hypothetical protein
MNAVAGLIKRSVMLAYLHGLVSAKIVATIFRLCGWLKGA